VGSLENFDIGIGNVIGEKYVVTARIGEGGMGIVLAARHRDLDELVALKVLRPALRENPDIAARFADEARTSARIKSTHVARVRDVSNVDGHPYIVMEHLRGEDLSALIRRRGASVPVAEAADLLLQACEAVHEAHTLGIVHRDLKPSNLFITREPDGTAFVKVLDFGISKSVTASDMSTTKRGDAFGSPHYMSPEQFASTKDVDLRTDVWSLGVILYELLTGTLPFPGEAFGEVCTQVVRGTYESPSTRRPGIPPVLEQLIADALERDREHRVPSVEAFAARLAPFAKAAGRLSNRRIQGLAARAATSPGDAAPPDDAVDPQDESATRPPPIEDTSPMRATTGSTASLGARADDTEPRPRKWPRFAAIGVAVAAATTAVALPRVRHAPAPATLDAPSAVTAAPTPAGPASATADPPAIGDTKPQAPTTADPIGTPQPAIDTPPTTPPSTTGASSAASLRTTGSPKSSVATGCASGATPECEAACTAKRPGSCVALAEALLKGQGAPKDVQRALGLYKSACDGGTADACNELGKVYMNGDGVKRDPLQAIDRYTDGCKQGSAGACTNLGLMHYNGDGVEKKESLAVPWFLKGCEGKNANGCFNLSVAYSEGRDGIPTDGKQAIKFAHSACGLGSHDGCVREGMLMIQGGDATGGLALLDTQCKQQKNTEACDKIAGLYKDGSAAGVAADPVQYREYAQKACDQHSKKWCDALLLQGDKDSLQASAARANAGYEATCAAGTAKTNAMACAFLGENLLKGNGVSLDRERGMAMLRKACAEGYAPACGEVLGAGQ
jgi:serine/threonine protein kinase/TPR repeat protein